MSRASLSTSPARTLGDQESRAMQLAVEWVEEPGNSHVRSQISRGLADINQANEDINLSYTLPGCIERLLNKRNIEVVIDRKQKCLRVKNGGLVLISPENLSRLVGMEEPALAR